MPAPTPVTHNSRLARFLFSPTSYNAMVVVNKTHGFKISTPTAFSKDTGHGDDFESNLPGLRDWSATLDRWYDSAYSVLVDAVANRTLGYFAAYPDYSDTTIFWSGRCYLSMKEQDLSLGNTVGESFEIVNGGSMTYTHP